jgi:thiosulfate/3-mercaptopyruvate sulfurtransferase
METLTTRRFILAQSTTAQDGTLEQIRLPGLLVTPGWLEEHLTHPGIRLLDVRDRESYEEGHLPNAVWVDLQALSCEVDGVPGMLLPAAGFAGQMSRLGVDGHVAAVLYDDNWGMPAARVLWGLIRYGHTAAAVLNGGWDRWQEEGRPRTPEQSPPPPANFQAQPAAEHIAERAWLIDRLGNPDLVLVDTRTPGEYAQGHLPGALCWDWMNGVPVNSWNVLRPAEELLAELATLGITPEREIVTYCRSGARAAHTYLLLRSLGYPRVRNYDGS